MKHRLFRRSFLRTAMCCGSVLGAVLGTGCSGPKDATPLPEPPSMVDLGKVGPPPRTGEFWPNTYAVLIEGRPGAIPAGSELRVTGLDTNFPPALASGREDGSFSLQLPGDFGQEFRFVVVHDGKRQAALDALYVGDPSAAEFVRSVRFECVSLQPGYELTLPEASAVLRLSNGCDEALSLSSFGSRTDATLFSLRTPLPPAIQPGEAISLEFARGAGVSGPVEEVLFLNLTLAGDVIRYPFTLIAR